jgi:hypothetical protein
MEFLLAQAGVIGQCIPDDGNSPARKRGGQGRIKLFRFADMPVSAKFLHAAFSA